MSRSLLDIQGSALLVSQFTLFGDLRRGSVPFRHAALPDIALTLYETSQVGPSTRRPVQRPLQADMRVLSEGRGPITILIDSRSRSDQASA